MKKTKAVLVIDNITGTARLLELVLHMWNCLNVKSSKFCIMLTDQNTKPFSDTFDKRLKFLQNMASTYKKIDTYSPSMKVRKSSLISNTSDALH